MWCHSGVTLPDTDIRVASLASHIIVILIYAFEWIFYKLIKENNEKCLKKSFQRFLIKKGIFSRLTKKNKNKKIEFPIAGIHVHQLKKLSYRFAYTVQYN